MAQHLKVPDPVSPIPVAGESDDACRVQYECGQLQANPAPQPQLYQPLLKRVDVRGRHCELNRLPCWKWGSDPFDRNALAATDVDSEP